MSDREAAERLEQAIELHTIGVEMKRRALTREHPEESEAEIEARLRRWLLRVGEPR